MRRATPHAALLIKFNLPLNHPAGLAYQSGMQLHPPFLNMQDSLSSSVLLSSGVWVNSAISAKITLIA